MTRPYRLKCRAEARDATRQRIIDVTIRMHQAVGDDGTTISEIARRAGVSRVTVYRHFPDERALLAACTGHYLAQNQPPDQSRWQGIADPETRLATALHTIYRWWSANEVMMARADEDAPTNPILAELLAPFAAYWEVVRDNLDGAWATTSSVRRAAIGHALAFATWRSLCRNQGLTEDQAVDVMLGAVRSVGEDATAQPIVVLVDRHVGHGAQRRI